MTADVAAGVAASGAGDGNTAAGRYSVEADQTRPTAAVTGPSATQRGAFDVNIAFSEPVTGFEQADITAGNASVTAFSGSGASYSATIEPAATGTVTVDVAAMVATDATGNPNLPARQFSVRARLSEPPSVTITGPAEKQRGAFWVTIAFSEAVTGFEGGDVTVGNGFVRKFSGSGADYRAEIRITPGFSGTVTADVAAGVAASGAGDGNTAAGRYSVEADQTRPTAAVTGPSATQRGAFDVNIAFSEPVTGFEQADITAGNASVTAFSGSGASYSATIEPAATGTVTVDVAAMVATDATGNPNLPARQFSVRARLSEPPSVTITGPAEKQRGAFWVTIAFSEAVTGFEEGDVTVGNGFVRKFSGSGADYRAEIRITPGFSGTVTADVAAGVAASGAGNGNTAAGSYSVEADQTRPTAAVTGPSATQRGAFDVNIAFSEPVTGFGQADLTVGNASVTAFSGSGASYSATIEPAATGTVTVDVAAMVATDATGNPNLPARRFSVQARLSEPPSVTITGPSDPQRTPFDVAIVFSEAVTGFEQADVTVGNGLAAVFTGSGASYTATILPTTNGTVTVDVAANVAVNGAGSGNTAAGQYSVRTIVSGGATSKSQTNAPPVIAVPGDKTYEQGEAITAFGITVTDADGDSVTVTVTGLPSGLSYTNGLIQGTVAVAAGVKDHTVTISADDGVSAAVTATFTITVTPHWNRPTVNITGPTTPQKGSFSVTIIFSEQVTGFTQSDVTVGNGSVTSFSGSYDTWSVDITPAATGTVTVDIAENVAEDGAEYGNVAASRFSVEADLDAPTAGIGGPTASQSESFELTITFSESVTGFDRTDVTVGGGAVAAWSGSDSSYTATITPTASGTLTVDVAANAAADGAGNGNTAASRFSVPVTLTRPTVVISGPTGVQTGAFQVSISFSESVSGFAQADVTVGNGQVTGWTETNGTVAVTITPSASGRVTVDVGANAASDGDNNGNLAAVRYSVQANLGEPTVTTSCPTGVQTGAFQVEIDFSEAVTGFVQADVTVGNGRVTGWAETNGDALVIIAPAATGTVTIDVPANVATDGDGYGNLAAEQCSVEADLSNSPAVTIEDASASEGDSITFTVKLSKAVSGGLTVTPSFAGGNATKGTDYTENTSALSFTGTEGETKSFTVSTTEDEVVELDETFTVGLAVSGTSVIVVQTDTGTGTITNDDSATVTVSDVSGAEGGPGFTFVVDGVLFTEIALTATLDKAVQGGFQLYLTASAGTATMGADQFTNDFGANPVSIWFDGTAGERESLDRNWVVIYQDEIVEATETFGISYSLGPLPGAGPVLPPVPSAVTVDGPATGTIIDDDSATVTIADAAATEGDAITFAATVDKAVAGGFTVTPGFTDGTARKGTDYTENTTGLTFAGTAGETQTFTVATTENTNEEANRTFTVSQSLSGTSLPVTATDTAIGTIIDEDGATSLTITDASANEGESMTFTVTLNQAVSGGFTVTPSFTDGTAAKGTDYTENTAALSFAGTASETQTFTVATTEDADFESDETFTVSLSVSGTSTTVDATDAATGTIVNDDSKPNAPPVITDPQDKTYLRGEAITAFDITVTDAEDDSLTISVTGLPSGLSYANGQVSGTVATDAAVQSYTATISAVDGTNAAVTETFTVHVVASALSIPGAPALTRTQFSQQTDPALDVSWTAAPAKGVTLAGYEARYRKQGVASWTTWSGTLSATKTSLNLPGLDAGATYEAQVRAYSSVRGDYDYGDWSATGTGTANTPPAATSASFSGGTFPVGSIADYYETGQSSAGPFFSDADGDTLTYSAAAQHPALLGVSLSGAAGEAHLRVTLLNQGSSKVTYTARDAYGGSVTRTATIGISAKVGRSIVEHSPAGTAVGAPVTGTPYNDQALTYSLTGKAADSRLFAIDSATGQISVASGATLDYDTDDTHREIEYWQGEVFAKFYRGKVEYTVNGHAAAINVLIAVTENVAPAITDPGDKTYARGDTITAFGITVSDADGGTPTVTVTGLPSGLSYADGQVSGTVAQDAAVQDHTVTITANDGVNAAVTETFTITVTSSGTQNSPPEIIIPSIQNYGWQYEPIWPWCIKVEDDDGDDLKVWVTGVPPALSFSESDPCRRNGSPSERGVVSGIAMPDSPRIPARRSNTFDVTIHADDGVNDVVTHSFNYFVLWPKPQITSPGDKTYQQGEQIAAFDIQVAADEEYKEVTLTGLPDSLSYESTSEQVAGTVAANAEIRDYAVTITADGDGPGFRSPVTETFTITVISSRPTAHITGPTATQNGSFDVAIDFSEPVTGFEQADVTVGNGTATALSGSGASYTATVTPTATGTVTVDVAANVAEDEASNGNTAASQYSVEADLDAPTVTIGGPAASQSESFDVTITFSESVTGFEKADVTVGNGAATALSGSGASYTATITPTATGTLAVDVAANVAEDGAGNGNTAADQFTVPVTLEQPTVVLSCPIVVQTGPFEVAITFSESVTGFEKADVTVGNGTATALSGSGASYTASVTPTATGTLTMDVAANVAANGANRGNLAAQQCSVDIDLDDPKLTIAEASASEGDSMTFTVTLDKAVAGGFRATPSFTDVTATKGVDYTENTAALTFQGTSGEEQTFVVATTEDAASESDETFTVGLSVSGTSLAVTDTGTATGTITDDDVLRPTGVTLADAVATEGDSLTFTVTLNNAVSGGFTATPSFTDGTATKGTDYAENTAALSFAGTAGETQSFKVQTSEDAASESDETFTVGLSVAGTSLAVTATDATGLIFDDDAAAVTIADVVAAEGDSLMFTVTLDHAVSGGLTVTPSFTDGTATKGTDYTENTGALTFAGTAGETQSFKVATTEDSSVEADETFIVNLTVSGTSLTVRATDIATGTIAEDDTATLTIADASANEGDPLTFTVTLDKAVSGGFTVTPSFTDGTATKGTDYTENTTGLAFTGTAGEQHTFTVATAEDTEEESAETFTVGLAVSGTRAPVTATDSATGTIHSEVVKTPSPVNPAVTIGDASAPEGDSITFTVTLDKAVAGGLTVTPRFTDGTASKGTDYTENTAGLAFAGAAGEAKTFAVATTEDADQEDDETFTVSVAVSGTQTAVTATDTATGTIINHDAPAVTIEDASASEGDSITFTVTLDKAVAGGLGVTPSFTDGTAIEGADYTAKTAALTFAGTAGETQTFTVATTGDDVVETDETFTVELSVSGTSKTVSASDNATGTITDDDKGGTGGNATVTVADAGAAEGDPVTFTVTLHRAVAGGLTVTPVFTDGTATSGTDYTPNTTALTFAGTAGETQTLTVATTQDEAVEHDETFTVGLSVSGAPDGVTTGDPATGTIADNDKGGTGGNATVTIADAGAAEGNPITFTVTLHRAVAGGLTVTPAFTDGTATSGTDYTPNTTALTFAGTAGETQTLTVATTQDEAVEHDETFTVGVSVSGAPDGVTTGDPATGTIADDDKGGTGGNATVTIADAGAAEGNPITFTVTLHRAVAGGLTVTPAFTDGTATSGTDYTPNTTALTFAGNAGETQTLTVATTQDEAVEDDETFTVGLSVSNAPDGVTTGDPATGTITDDDEGDTDDDEGDTDDDEGDTDDDEGGTDSNATVTIADAGAAEGDPITFTMTLDKAVAGGLTVTPGFTDGTATGGTDYTANTTALTFAGTAGETQTFTVATYQDEVIEHDETFTVGLTVSNAPDGVTTGDPATGTIADDDKGGTGGNATVTVSDAGAAEGDPVTFTVTLHRAVSGGLTVTPAFTDGTATSGTDYTPDTTALTFAGTAGETQTFTVATTQDEVIEHDETFTVGLSISDAPDGVTTGTPATGTITDDDDGGTGGNATVTIADAGAAEGGPITFTVTLHRAVAGGLTVTPAFTDGTATGGTDYTANTTALTFAGTAGETQTFTVATSQDEVIEHDETFTVSLTVSSAPDGVTTGTPATGTITDDDGGGTGGNATVTIAGAGAAEGDPITFTVTLHRAVAGGLTVTPAFTDGTATGGTDYRANTTALTFAGTAGETQTFTVATSQDEVIEHDETFTVSLTVSSAPDGVTTGTPATGTITDDDGGGTGGNATVTIAGAGAAEGDPITFTVTLHRAVAGGLTVTPAFTDGTATGGTDYRANATALTLAGTAGETQTFTVATTQDNVIENDETFTVRLTVSNAPEGVTTGDPATGTITDDDAPPPTVNLAAGPTSVPENARPTRVTVTATLANGPPFSADRTVTVSVGVGASASGGGGGQATSGADYSAVEDFTIIIPAGETTGTGTFLLVPTDDRVVEGDETIDVSGAAEGLTVTGTQVTVADDDAVSMVNLVLGQTNVSEGAPATPVTVTALFSSHSTFRTDTAVTVSVGGGTNAAFGGRTAAIPGTDYAAVPDFRITIPAGRTSGTGTFTLLPTNDDVVETDEMISVWGVAEGLTVNGTTLTLSDDDTVPERRRALELSVTRIGRTVATQAVDAIGERLDASSRLSRTPASGNRFETGPLAVAGILAAGGVNMPALKGNPATEAVSALRGFAPGSGSKQSIQGALNPGGGQSPPTPRLLSFTVGDKSSGTGRWAFWTTGATTNFTGRQGDLALDGRMGAAYLGVDRRLGSSGVVGVAVSRNQGGLDVASAQDLTGDVGARLTTVYPYLSWSPGEKTDIWGIVGLGRGKVDMNDGIGSVQTEGRLGMAAMGLRQDMADIGPVNLAVRADAFRVGMVADEVEGMTSDIEGRSHRARLMLDGSVDWPLSSSTRLTPSVEVGARADGGDAETGPGMELGGGLAYVDSRLGLDIATSGRWLTAHRDEEFGEWGGNVSIRRMPASPNRGLSISLESAWGADASGVHALWAGRNPGGSSLGTGLQSANAGSAWHPDRVDLEVAYGKDLPAGRGSLQPFGQVLMNGAGSRHLRMGARVALGEAGDGGGVRLELLGEQRNDAGTPSYGAGLNLAVSNLKAAGGLLAPFGTYTYQGDAAQRLTVGTRWQPGGDGGNHAWPAGFSIELAAEAVTQANQTPRYGLVLRGTSDLGWR